MTGMPGGISLEAEASDGEEAFRRALEVRPDILISDIRMPEKDGLELCSLLRDGAARPAYYPAYRV